MTALSISRHPRPAACGDLVRFCLNLVLATSCGVIAFQCSLLCVELTGIIASQSASHQGLRVAIGSLPLLVLGLYCLLVGVIGLSYTNRVLRDGSDRA